VEHASHPRGTGHRRGAGANRGSARTRYRAGWTFIELAVALIVLVVAAAMAITSLSHTIVADVRAAAEVVASDLAYVRQLAVANGTTYEVRWDAAGGIYEVVHVGPNARFDQVPLPPGLSTASAIPNGYVHRMSDLPLMGEVRIVSVEVTEPSRQAIASFTFEPSGEVSPLQPIRIRLGAGRGDAARYVDIEIVPQTGLMVVGDPMASDEPQVATAAIE